VTRKLKEFAKMCCACNTSPQLALRASVTAVTLLVKYTESCTQVGVDFEVNQHDSKMMKPTVFCRLKYKKILVLIFDVYS